jgi:hypothetical protein
MINKSNFKEAFSMKKLLLVMAMCLFAFGMANADDPGEPDSVIVQITQVDTSVTEIFVWVYMATDDSVFFYTCPLQFTPTGQGITYSHTSYFSLLLQWDEVFDSFLVAEDYLRMVAWADIGGDDNPPLYTSMNRVHVFNLVFDVDPIAEDQCVFIDTTHDQVNGSLLFGLTGGIESFVPVFVAGWIEFGDCQTGTDDPIVDLPTEFALKQNYPNPFNPSTNLPFDLPKAQNVSFNVYNILGQHVKTLADGMYESGRHTVSWNGTNSNGEDVPSGIYFYSLKTEEFSKTSKMMLIR